MKQMNRKVIVDDWQIILFAVCVGLIIAFLAWSLAHISFIMLWMVISMISIPMWNQIAKEAQKKYKGIGILDAILCYIFSNNFWDNVEEDESIQSLED